MTVIDPNSADALEGYGINDDSAGDWRAAALCAQTDPDAFHPEQGQSTADAKKVCLGCPVRDECLEWALDTGEEYGVWGGLSAGQRRKLKKERAQSGTCGVTRGQAR